MGDHHKMLIDIFQQIDERIQLPRRSSLELYVEFAFILCFGYIAGYLFYMVSKLPDLLMVCIVCSTCRAALMMRLRQYSLYINMITDHLTALNNILNRNLLSTDDDIMISIQDQCYRLRKARQYLNCIYSKSLIAITLFVLLETVVDAHHLYATFTNGYGINYLIGECSGVYNKKAQTKKKLFF